MDQKEEKVGLAVIQLDQFHCQNRQNYLSMLDDREKVAGHKMEASQVAAFLTGDMNLAIHQFQEQEAVLHQSECQLIPE